MIHPILELFGICAGAATVYLAASILGESTLSDLARATKMPRSTVKRYAEELFEKRFLNFFVKKKHRIVVTEPPERIKQMLEDHVASFSKSIPLIKQAAQNASYHSRVHFYEGIADVRHIYEDMLAEQRPIDAITSPEDTQGTLGNFFNHFIQQRTKKKIPMRLLALDTPYSRKFKKTDAEFIRKTQFLAPHIPFHTASYIYGTKTAMISLRSANPSGVIIEDAIIADAQRAMFEYLWKLHSSLTN